MFIHAQNESVSFKDGDPIVHLYVYVLYACIPHNYTIKIGIYTVYGVLVGSNTCVTHIHTYRAAIVMLCTNYVSYLCVFVYVLFFYCC